MFVSESSTKKQGNGYFWHFLTAGQFEILQGLMKQEGALDKELHVTPVTVLCADL